MKVIQRKYREGQEPWGEGFPPRIPARQDAGVGAWGSAQPCPPASPLC